MKINWLKVGKVAGATLPVLGAIIGSVVGHVEQKQTTVETTEKLFKEYINKSK